jgi:hypothetical protein
MNNANDIAAAFLAAVPEGKSKKWAEDALQVIVAGVEAGSVLNVDFQDAKRSLDSAAEGIFRALVNPFWVGKGGTIDADPVLNKDLNKLHWEVNPTGLHAFISASKKLAKVKFSHPMVDAMRAGVATVLPLALVVEDLKKVIVKGRRPPTAEVLAERARKAAMVKSMSRATCGCCFGDQAVLPNGYIHDHGYSRPREWMKTASCYGRQFRPLEVSDEGPRFMVDLLTRTEASLLQGIENLRKATKLPVERGSKRNERGVRIPVFEDIEVGHPQFERVRERRIYAEEANLKGCRADLAEFKKVIAEWKPAEVA